MDFENDVASLLERHGLSKTDLAKRLGTRAKDAKLIKLQQGLEAVLTEHGQFGMPLKRFKREAGLVWNRVFNQEAKPMNSYQLFLKENMEAVMKEFPDKPQGDRLRILTHRYNQSKLGSASSPEPIATVTPDPETVSHVVAGAAEAAAEAAAAEAEAEQAKGRNVIKKKRKRAI